jgi:quinoprotein glucose dehydrogenase
MKRLRFVRFATVLAWAALGLATDVAAEGVPTPIDGGTSPASPGGTVEALPARTIADEVAALAGGRISAQQKALRRLAKNPDPQADQVLLAQFERLAEGTLPHAVWLELLEGAASRENPALKALLAKREKELATATDPLARFRECLVGGDGEVGRRIFTKKVEAGCVRCHSIDGEGAQIGPDLTWLRRSVQRLHLLESLIVPNATMASGFGHALIKLNSGEELAGVITIETEESLTMTFVADGKKRVVKTADIEERTPLPSPMPGHFGMVLTKREIRDLIEFLAEGD